MQNNNQFFNSIKILLISFFSRARGSNESSKTLSILSICKFSSFLPTSGPLKSRPERGFFESIGEWSEGGWRRPGVGGGITGGDDTNWFSLNPDGGLGIGVSGNRGYDIVSPPWSSHFFL